MDMNTTYTHTHTHTHTHIHLATLYAFHCMFVNGVTTYEFTLAMKASNCAWVTPNAVVLVLQTIILLLLLLFIYYLLIIC